MASIENSIWLLHGPNWSLPVRAWKMGSMFRIRPAGQLTNLMLAALQARIAELGTNNGHDWFFTKNTLTRFADKMEFGIPVDDTISWVSHHGRTTLAKQPAGMEGFFEEFTRSGYAQDVPEAQMRYGQLCQHLFEWLAIRRKPVDFGFAILDPLPVRPNWRDILAFKVMAGCPISRIKKNMGSGELMMYSPGHKCILWTISVRHNAKWWRAIIAGEKLLRRRSKMSLRYLLHSQKRLAQRTQQMYESFTDYLAQIRKPILEYDMRHASRIQGTVSKPRIKPERFLEGSRTVAQVDGRRGSKIQRCVVVKPSPSVPQMPGFRSEEEDLRNGAEKPEDPKDGTEG